MSEKKWQVLDDVKYEQQVSTQTCCGPFIVHKPINSVLYKGKCRWILQEVIKFIVFYQKYQKQIIFCNRKQKWILYKKMSRFIKTRNYVQCKNFHFKAVKKFITVQNMTNYLITANPQINILGYFQEYQKYLQQVQNSLCLKYEYDESSNDINEQELKLQQYKNLIRYPTQYQNKQVCKLKTQTSFPYMKDHKMQQKLDDKTNQFKKCHQLFLLWTNKFNELIKMESDLHQISIQFNSSKDQPKTHNICKKEEMLQLL